MGHRLTRIYTRTGDDGTTGLADGARVPKDAARIEAIGAVDELNSLVGLLLADTLPEEVSGCLTRVQHELFDLGGELSLPRHPVMTAAHVDNLEKDLERFNAGLPALREFILPGGSRAAALAHVARAACRRAERRLVTLSRRETLPPAVIRYLNRLSDLLFVVARVLNRGAGIEDVLWRSEKSTRK